MSIVFFCDKKNVNYIISIYSFDEGDDLCQPIETPLKLENDGKMLLIFPTTVCHVIDETSPLYDLSQQSLNDRKYIYIPIQSVNLTELNYK